MHVRKGLLHAVLSHLNRTIDRHASIPVLQHVKLDADGTTLRIEATDITSHVVAIIPCNGRFSGCLPGRQLAEFVKPDDAADRHTLVEFLPEPEGGKVTVAVEAAMTTLAILPTADFPLRPGDKHAAHDWRGAGTWSAPSFAEALGWCALAVGTDETRRHLTGVLFESKQVIGLDGHRLHLVRMPGLGSTTLLPGKAIHALLRVLPKNGDVAAMRAKDVLRFTCQTGDIRWEVEASAMTEKFPPYDQVIPSEKNASYVAKVDRDAFARAVARLPKSKDRRHQGVRIIVNGAIKLERDGDDGAIAACTVPVISTTHSGPDSVLGVNGVYLTDAFSCDGVPTVVGHFGGPLDPVRFDLGSDRTAVVMPMRL